MVGKGGENFRKSNKKGTKMCTFIVRGLKEEGLVGEAGRNQNSSDGGMR